MMSTFTWEIGGFFGVKFLGLGQRGGGGEGGGGTKLPLMIDNFRSFTETFQLFILSKELV